MRSHKKTRGKIRRTIGEWDCFRNARTVCIQCAGDRHAHGLKCVQDEKPSGIATAVRPDVHGTIAKSQPVDLKSAKYEIERIYRMSSHVSNGAVLILRHMQDLTHLLVF